MKQDAWTPPLCACRQHTLGYPIMYYGLGKQTLWGKTLNKKTCCAQFTITTVNCKVLTPQRLTQYTPLLDPSDPYGPIMTTYGSLWTLLGPQLCQSGTKGMQMTHVAIRSHYVIIKGQYRAKYCILKAEMRPLGSKGSIPGP